MNAAEPVVGRIADVPVQMRGPWLQADGWSMSCDSIHTKHNMTAILKHQYCTTITSTNITTLRYTYSLLITASTAQSACSVAAMLQHCSAQSEFLYQRLHHNSSSSSLCFAALLCSQTVIVARQHLQCRRCCRALQSSVQAAAESNRDCRRITLSVLLAAVQHSIAL
jgi:hypothetical protein